MPTLIDIDHVTKRFRSTTAVDDVTFSLLPGQALGLLGPNGAGKTTTMRLLQGALRPSSGEITIAGHRPLEVPRVDHVVGFAFDGTGLPAGQTVGDHLAAHRLSTGVGERRMRSHIEEFDLGRLLRRRVKQLSTGERKRVSLATAMTAEPQVLVLDEPTNGLDIEGAHWIREVLLGHVASGGSLLVSSHILSEIERVVDSVVVIKQHQVFSGTLDELRLHGSSSLEDAYLSLVSPTTRSLAA